MDDTPPKKLECYEAHKALSSGCQFITDDGYEVVYVGAKGNPRSQSIELRTSDGKSHSYPFFWGSEGVALALLRQRKSNEHPNRSD